MCMGFFTLCEVNYCLSVRMNTPLLIVLVLADLCSRLAAGQSCVAPSLSEVELMDRTRPESNRDTLYLYVNLFNSSATPCNGVLERFDVCYEIPFTFGQRQTVFYIILLEDIGTDYIVRAVFLEREDRECERVNTLCCKQLPNPDNTLIVSANYVMAVRIPEDNGNNLLRSLSSESPGFVASSIPANIVNEDQTISKANLMPQGGSPGMIPDRAIRAVIQPLPDDTTAPPTETTPEPDPSGSVPTSASPTPSVLPSGGGNGGAVAAGVIVSLLVVMGIGAAATIVAVVLWKRSRSRVKSSLGPVSGISAFDNRLYGGSSLVMKVSAEGKSSDAVPVVEAANHPEEEFHEYEAPEILDMPQEYEVLQSVSVQKQGSTLPTMPMQGRINPYADTLSSRGGSIGTTSTIQASMAEAMLDSEIVYEVPANDENSLYAQYRRIDIKHIPRSEIQLQDVIGSGQFGTVQRAVWKTRSEGKVAVAVKMLKKGLDGIDKVKFLQEAAIMGQFTHPSIVKLHGVAIFGEPKMIILELLALGDLRRTLLELRPSDGKEVENGLPHLLLSYCRQVASGMSYLAGKAFVHRDLAARNILVSDDGDIKIADFGMSRDLLEENYYVSHGGKIPVKWTAPEAIHYRKYSTASDVWSFGAVMYETWSLGHKPFEAYTNSEAISMGDSGFRLPPPPGCPRALYALMIKCWHSVASERPDFPRIVQHLSLPDTKLLKWAEEDRAATPAEAATLGAELKAAVDLYKELQNVYLNLGNIYKNVN